VNLQRITRVHVLIAGVAIAVGIALLFTFMLIQPQKKKIALSVRSAEDDEAYASQRRSFEGRRDEALQREAEVTASYDEIMETRMPEIDLSDPIGGMVRLWYFPDEERELMERWLASTGAQVSGLSYPSFGADLANTNMAMFDPLNWNLTVQVKDFPELLEWLKKLPEAPRFMVMHSVTVQGPRQPGQPLVASIPVTLYMWTGAEAPAGGAAPTAGAAGVRGGGRRGARGGGRGRGGDRRSRSPRW